MAGDEGDEEGAGVVVGLFCWQGGSLAPGQVQPGDWEQFGNFDEDDLCALPRPLSSVSTMLACMQTHAHMRSTTHPLNTKMRARVGGRWPERLMVLAEPGRSNLSCQVQPRTLGAPGLRVHRRQMRVGMARVRARGPAGVEGWYAPNRSSAPAAVVLLNHFVG